MIDKELMERLIVEAALRGSIEHQRDDALSAMEGAANAAHSTAEQLAVATKENAWLRKSIENLNANVRRISESENELIGVLRNFSEDVRTYLANPRKRDAKAALRKAAHAAREFADGNIPF